MKNCFKIYLKGLFILLLISSCEKFLDVGNPQNQIAASYVYESNSSSAAVLTGIYHDISNNNGGIAQGGAGLSLRLALAADEFELSPNERYGFSGTYRNISFLNYWSKLFNLINRANVSIEGLMQSKKLAIGVRQQLLGESLFIRAFCYFYLINLYGDVPLITSSDYRVNVNVPRSSIDTVYRQVINDLLGAKILLKDTYVDADALSMTQERVRPNKWTAFALLSRVYLYNNEWSKAIHLVDSIVNETSLYNLVDLNSAFLKNNQESIWQLEPIDPSGMFKNPRDANILIMTNGPNPRQPISVSSMLRNSFENNDLRKFGWLIVDSSMGIDYYCVAKYRGNLASDNYKENIVVFRLAEQYLIRAEAKCQLGELKEAIIDLNLIRSRAGLSNLQETVKDSILLSIMHERRVEFFSEWGHRWFDLKRSGKLDNIMRVVAPLKGSNWQDFRKLFEIPVDDIRLNPNITQNPGYGS